MNRPILLGALLVALAAGAYYQFGVVPAQRAADDAAAAAKTAADEAAAAAQSAAEAAADVSTTAAEQAGDAVAGAAEAVKDAATEAAGAVTDAATDAAASATGAATDAAAAVTDAATGAAATASEAAGMVWDSTKLTADDILARINAAPIADSMKQTLTASFNAVKDNPTGVQTVLDQLKQAMGL